MLMLFCIQYICNTEYCCQTIMFLEPYPVLDPEHIPPVEPEVSSPLDLLSWNSNTGAMTLFQWKVE